jgi:hypothetical protein
VSPPRRTLSGHPDRTGTPAVVPGWFHCRVVHDPQPGPGEAAPDRATEGAGGLPAPPPGYVWVYPAPYEPPRPWRAPRWLKVTSALWAVALLVGGLLYSLYGRPSVREQTSIGNARPVVDTAVVDVLAAAGPDPVAAVSPFTSAGSCRITTARAGASFVRTIDLFTRPGTEPALLDRVVAGLPARYHAKVTTGPGGGLYADAGDYVAVVGSVPAPGQVQVRALTGCRDPAGSGAAEPTAAPDAPAVAAISAVFDRLGTRPGTSRDVAVLGCGDGRSVRSTQAAAGDTGPAASQLGASLAGLAADPVASGPAVYAYRSGQVDVVARRTPEGVTVTATTRCAS